MEEDRRIIVDSIGIKIKRGNVIFRKFGRLHKFSPKGTVLCWPFLFFIELFELPFSNVNFCCNTREKISNYIKMRFKENNLRK